MRSDRKNRIIEIAIIVIVGAVVSVLNTLWLRSSLIKEIEKISKENEANILRRQNKVTDIGIKQKKL